MYDRANRSGLLYEKVRYRHRKRHVKKTNSPTLVATIDETDKQAIDDLISFFDSCVLSRDKNEILGRLQSSAHIRAVSNQNDREFFDKCFQLYRLDPQLVRLLFQ